MPNILDFIHDTKFEDLPDATIDNAIRCLIDTLGVGVGGTQTPMSRIIRNHAANVYGAGKATLWQDGRAIHPAGAALANATTIDSLDAHDGHKLVKGHVGCGVFPGLVAIMQGEGITNPKEFLSCIVIGYEIGTRAGISLHASVSDYHTSGAWVCLAIASLGARCLRLNPSQTREALGIAEYHGPRSQMMRTIDQPTMVKDGSGWGAMAGVTAAYLAKDGFTGAPAVTVEGRDTAGYWRDLGQKWHINEQYIKLYPVCRWAQPAVEGVLALVKAHALAPAQVAKIHVESFYEATRLSTIPTNTEQAQYSLPFSVAAALVRGTIGVEEITESGLRDPQILAQAHKVTMGETKEFNDAFPAQRFAQVHLYLKTGDILSSEKIKAQGDPENRLSDQVIDDKFRSLTLPTRGKAWSEEFLSAARDLINARSVETVFRMISDKTPAG